MTNSQSHTRTRQGFTLIEVMLAVVIIGLGVLGLSALFAGAASQQRRSIEDNLAVASARNAEALMSRSLGEIQGPDVAEFTINNLFGQWLPTRSVSADGRDDQSLTPLVFPVGGGTSHGLFALVDSPELTLYTAPNDPAGMIARVGKGVSTDPFFEQYPVESIPDRWLQPTSVAIRVTVKRREIEEVGGVPQPEMETTRVHMLLPADNLPDDLRRDPYLKIVLEDPDPPYFYPTPIDHDTANESLIIGSSVPLMLVNLAYVPMAERRDAAIEAFNIPLWSSLDPLPPGILLREEWIDSIVIEPYQWRNSRLVSLNDRLVYETDANFPGGRRPTLGYTMLFRLLPGGESQFTVFSYALQALNVPGPNRENLPFIPPENLQFFDESDETSLLRLVTLELRFDENTEQYYVLADESDTEQAAAVTPGQVLLMAGSTTPLDPTDLSYLGGSDIAVRVVAQRRDPTDPTMLRGVLDRSPRVRGQSPLQTLSATQSIQVWCLNPLVKSLTEDETEWKVRPIDARQFQANIRFGN